MDMQQSNSAEEQFAVAIEAGEWYDSDSDTENQDTDSGESSSAQVWARIILTGYKTVASYTCSYI